MLTIERLSKRYAKGDKALDAVDLAVPSGQVLGLIGPSGAGKSTLIRCVNRLVEPSAGRIHLGEVEAGTVYLNRCDHADLYLPWGGIKDSGLGRTNGQVGLLETTVTKAFHIRDLGA